MCEARSPGRRRSWSARVERIPTNEPSAQRSRRGCGPGSSSARGSSGGSRRVGRVTDAGGRARRLRQERRGERLARAPRAPGRVGDRGRGRQRPRAAVDVDRDRGRAVRAPCGEDALDRAPQPRGAVRPAIDALAAALGRMAVRWPWWSTTSTRSPTACARSTTRSRALPDNVHLLAISRTLPRAAGGAAAQPGTARSRSARDELAITAAEARQLFARCRRRRARRRAAGDADRTHRGMAGRRVSRGALAARAGDRDARCRPSAARSARSATT